MHGIKSVGARNELFVVHVAACRRAERYHAPQAFLRRQHPCYICQKRIREISIPGSNLCDLRIVIQGNDLHLAITEESFRPTAALRTKGVVRVRMAQSNLLYADFAEGSPARLLHKYRPIQNVPAGALVRHFLVNIAQALPTCSGATPLFPAEGCCEQRSNPTRRHRSVRSTRVCGGIVYQARSW